MKRSLIFAAVLVGACAQTDKQVVTSFAPKEGGFTYVAKADAYYTLEGGESDRIAWLEEYLSDNGICQKGYVMNKRQVVKVSEGAISNVYDIFYSGTCK